MKELLIFFASFAGTALGCYMAIKQFIAILR